MCCRRAVCLVTASELAQLEASTGEDDAAEEAVQPTAGESSANGHVLSDDADAVLLESASGWGDFPDAVDGTSLHVLREKMASGHMLTGA